MLKYRPGICVVGDHEAIIVNRSKMLCDKHNQDRLRGAKPEKKKAVTAKNILPSLQVHADTVFSINTRVRYADEFGKVKCYTCPAVIEWKYIQDGHFIPRKHLATRYLESNNKPQCPNCNETLEGNLEVYAEQLKKEYGEIHVEFLNRMKHVNVIYDRESYQELIDEYSKKNHELFKRLKLK